MKLFCIPHAGASSISYNTWKKYLDNNIEFVPVELPGHMTRSQEPFCANINEVLIDLEKSIYSHLKDMNEPYAIYGHSLGGFILYFLYFYLIESGFNPPIHLFFSSRWPPYYENSKGLLNLDDFEGSKAKILDMGGFKEEIINNEQMLNFYMKVLIADYRIIQSTTESIPKKIYSNMTILWSDDEPDIIDKDVYEWKEAAGSDIAFIKVKGTHFFPTEEPLKTTNLVNATLKKYL